MEMYESKDHRNCVSRVKDSCKVEIVLLRVLEGNPVNPLDLLDLKRKWPNDQRKIFGSDVI